MTHNILLRPVLTEKAATLAEDNRYAFVVADTANKAQIRAAVKARYPEVTVADVTTMVVRAKNKRVMTRKGVFAGRSGGYKKAIVTLSAGSINFYEDV